MSRRSSPRSQLSRKRKSNADEFETREFERTSSRHNKRHSLSMIAEPSINVHRLEDSILEDPDSDHTRSNSTSTSSSSAKTQPTTFGKNKPGFSVAVTKSVTLRRRRTIASGSLAAAKSRRSTTSTTTTSSSSNGESAPLRFNQRNYLCQESKEDDLLSSSECFVTCPTTTSKNTTSNADTTSSTGTSSTIKSKTRKKKSLLDNKRSSLSTTLSTTPDGPLPGLAWADSNEVWRLMLKKDRYYCRDSKLFDKHKALDPRMRSILFDWLVEVSEVYHLQRETFYLAMDFVDRYLSKVHQPIQKQQLQLIGVTCLFIAAKLEEIYPPKIVEFAFVTDQACDVNEILSMEHIVMKILDWDLAPITAIAWLNMILQLSSYLSSVSSSSSSSPGDSTTPAVTSATPAPITGSPPRQGLQPHPHHSGGIGDPFLQPIYDSLEFIQIAQLLDLCMLDDRSLCFRYSVIAASSYHHMAKINRKPLSELGFEWSQISSCVAWMSPFATVLRSHGEVKLARFKHFDTSSMHNIQTNVVNLDLLAEVHERQSQIESANARLSPDFTCNNTSVTMTPPASSTRRLSTPPRKCSARSSRLPSDCSQADLVEDHCRSQRDVDDEEELVEEEEGERVEQDVANFKSISANR